MNKSCNDNVQAVDETGEFQVATITARTPSEQASCGRLAVVEQVYHQRHGILPTAAESVFERVLDTAEQVYVREVVIGDRWQPLDCGWLEDASHLLIKNNEGHFVLVNPTDIERVAAMSRVLELSFDGDEPHILIPPKESARFTPAKAQRVWLRCPRGECKATLNVFPK